MIAHNPNHTIADELPLLKRSVLPVLHGPIAGMWWSVAGGARLATFLGRYERTQCSIVERSIHEGDVVLDIGAGCGYFTLLFAKLVGHGGQVIAVEPDESRASLLQHHVNINGLKQVQVLETSVSGKSEVKHRYADTTLDDLVPSLKTPPTHVRLAITRDELPTLVSGRETLLKYRPILFLSTHGQEVHHRCCKWLAEIGYQLRPLVGTNVSNAKQLICTPNQIRPVRAA